MGVRAPRPAPPGHPRTRGRTAPGSRVGGRTRFQAPRQRPRRRTRRTAVPCTWPCSWTSLGCESGPGPGTPARWQGPFWPHPGKHVAVRDLPRSPPGSKEGLQGAAPPVPTPACVRHSEVSPGARSRRAEAILSPRCHRHGPLSALPGSSPRDTFSRCRGPLVPLPPLSLGVTVLRVACLGRGPCWDLTARWELRDCSSVSPAQSSGAQTQGALPQRSDHQKGESDMPPGYPGGGWRRRQQSE